MPLSMATPNTAMKPIADGTDRYWPVTNSATRPPMVANGTLASISAAYLIELNAVKSSTKMKKIVIGTVTANFGIRSEEHKSDHKSLMRNSYAVFCMTKKQTNTQ